jgi:ribosome-associated protein
MKSNAPEDEQEFKSKTQLKKEMLDRQNLGETLTRLPKTLLEKCQLPEELQHAISEYKRIPEKRGARKRQLQFIGKLMRDIDISPIEQFLEEQGQAAKLAKHRFQELERIRDSLVQGDQSVLNELIKNYQELDIQHVRQLMRQADREAQQGKAPSASRKLFAFLKELPEV